MRDFLLLAVAAVMAAEPDLQRARDAQDRAGLEKLIAALEGQAAKKPADRGLQYQLALAQSYLSEVALEMKDKGLAKRAAEAGIQQAEKLVAADAKSARAHTVLGTLCAQVIPANVLAGLKYGRCAMDEINKALELDPKSADAWLRHGVGNYYLPAGFGGGLDKALQSFDKAIGFDNKLAEAYLWKGIALRKANRNADARRALEQAVKLNPARVWAKEQLQKTPAS